MDGWCLSVVAMRLFREYLRCILNYVNIKNWICYEKYISMFVIGLKKKTYFMF